MFSQPLDCESLGARSVYVCLVVIADYPTSAANLNEFHCPPPLQSVGFESPSVMAQKRPKDLFPSQRFASADKLPYQTVRLAFATLIGPFFQPLDIGANQISLIKIHLAPIEGSNGFNRAHLARVAKVARRLDSTQRCNAATLERQRLLPLNALYAYYIGPPFNRRVQPIESSSSDFQLQLNCHSTITI